jgi:acetyl-CoA carboxylase carboxyltransferase component
MQAPNGVIDVVVEDESEAADMAKRYLSYFQGRIDAWAAPDQRRLRRLIPENRLRVYDIRGRRDPRRPKAPFWSCARPSGSGS